MNEEPDVIIIGAGAAGLSAAKELTRQRLSYTLVEASHRIGGRAYSEEIAPNNWFDLGCSYLHQAETNPFVPIADNLGIVLKKDKGDLFAVDQVRNYCNGIMLDENQSALRNQYDQQCTERIIASKAQGKDSAVSDLVDLDSPYAAPLMIGMATANAADIDQTSAADLVNFINGYDFSILNGYGNLVKKWGGQVPVSLNTKVTSINWNSSGVQVETNRGTIRSQRVLVTVSTGILAANHIQFKPGLPAWKEAAISAVPTQTMNKIGVHFSRDVFAAGDLGVHHTWNENGQGSEIEANVMGLNTATIFVGGRFAVWLEKQGQQTGLDFALNQLTDVFGNDIRNHIDNSIVTAWATEPLTLGSYSCALPGHANQRVELAGPIDDKLYFAGEATIVGAQATCHGAYLSGIRAAQEIKKASDSR
ncbi:MAG TPA: FAD-dependent oxidoreductase [Gammaproteobacteria bacterium]|nr:FAD-dependent oxidoreductase [Gammaproteobacteria bacterium]HIK68386.1 FAD-dependent oxidoreductase [Pseudomonadales bacterium]